MRFAFAIALGIVSTGCLEDRPMLTIRNLSPRTLCFSDHASTNVPVPPGESVRIYVENRRHAVALTECVISPTIERAQ